MPDSFNFLLYTKEGRQDAVFGVAANPFSSVDKDNLLRGLLGRVREVISYDFEGLANKGITLKDVTDEVGEEGIVLRHHAQGDQVPWSKEAAETVRATLEQRLTPGLNEVKVELGTLE